MYDRSTFESFSNNYGNSATVGQTQILSADEDYRMPDPAKRFDLIRDADVRDTDLVFASSE